MVWLTNSEKERGNQKTTASLQKAHCHTRKHRAVLESTNSGQHTRQPAVPFSPNEVAELIQRNVAQCGAQVGRGWVTEEQKENG